MRNHAETPLLRKLNNADLREILAIQEAVLPDLPEGFIFPKDEAQLCTYLDGTRGVAFGIAQGGTLAAISLLRLPSAAEPNPATPFPFPLVPEADWPRHASFVEYTLVRPEARGRGYHGALWEVRVSHAAGAGMRWLCAGVALENVVSWGNLLAKGMAVVGMRTDLGYPLIGLLKPLRRPPLRGNPRESVEVPLRETSRHRALLGAGYIGVQRTSAGNLIYQRLICEAE